MHRGGFRHFHTLPVRLTDILDSDVGFRNILNLICGRRMLVPFLFQHPLKVLGGYNRYFFVYLNIYC